MTSQTPLNDLLLEERNNNLQTRLRESVYPYFEQDDDYPDCIFHDKHMMSFWVDSHGCYMTVYELSTRFHDYPWVQVTEIEMADISVASIKEAFDLYKVGLVLEA